MEILKNEKGQALAPQTMEMSLEDFKDNKGLDIYWLGGGGAMINSNGTIIMIDPLLEGFDMPLLREAPMKIKDAGHVDGIIITHIDNDHFSRMTCSGLKDRCDSYHAPHYVASVMKEELDIDALFAKMMADKAATGEEIIQVEEEIPTAEEAPVEEATPVEETPAEP